jgi:MOSC domain-containing protein YiiM
VQPRSESVQSWAAVGRIVSINVGRAAEIGTRRGHPVRSAIGKATVAGPVRIEGASVAGDEQADRTVHGGPDKAVYAYAMEDYIWWSRALGRDLPPGTFGENLTVEGVEVRGALVGERWRAGTALLEVCQPRLPCFKLQMRVGEPGFVRRFAEASRPGAYLRILAPGEVQAGDELEVLERPAHGVTVARVSDAIQLEKTPAALRAVLAAPALPDGLAQWLAERAA